MHKPIHVKSIEDWYPNGDKTQTPRKQIAVRVRKGATGGNRPGTFQGATNFKMR